MSLIGMRTTDNAGPENHEEEEGEKEEEEEEEGDYSHLPIDHGWAFVIVFGCFGVCALVVGTLKSFGVILVELSRRFNVPSSVLIGPQCLAGFFHLCLGPVANALSERYSHRLVVFVGGLLATIGLVSTSFVQSVPAFYVTYGVMSGVMGQHSLYNILPSVANERGISDEQGAIVVSILGATDLIGRVLFGWLADFGFVKRQTMYQINLTIFALIGFIVPHVTSFIGLCVVVMFLGIFTGGYTGIQLAVLSDKFGPEKLSSSWGFAAFFVSLALLINPVLSGIIRDVTGSWIGAVTLGAGVATFGSGILVVENLVIRMRR